jgi:poly-gamma-glutamate capsule biosynthesis protein CapA/YwtB (metallophosphatase superfamily)
MWLTMFAGQAMLAAQGPLVEIAAVGDLMLNGLAVEQPLFSEVDEILSSADIAVANLESPLCEPGEPTPYKSRSAIAAHRQYLLRADPAWATGLAEAGLDVLSLGNNHAMDYRWAGLQQTLAALHKHGLAADGVGEDRARAEQAVVVDVHGVRVAFASFLAFRGEGALRACSPAAEGRPGVNALYGGGSEGRARLEDVIQAARKHADIVVVSFHWGTERRSIPTSQQVDLGRAAIDLGADMVLGHHPHVLQPYEVYKGKPIYYSLGNFVAPVCSGALGRSVVFSTTWRGSRLREIRLTPVRLENAAPRPLRDKSRDSALAQIAASVARLREREKRG